ncbi:MAG: alpha-ketoacid dehydrogenase subunit beta, partial [Planctomycetota bacterium]
MHALDLRPARPVDLADGAQEGPAAESAGQHVGDHALVGDESVVLMGQDIAAFEGAFRATKKLHATWPERVFDTPIAESGTLGIAIGAALSGYRPVVEMQFA